MHRKGTASNRTSAVSGSIESYVNNAICIIPPHLPQCGPPSPQGEGYSLSPKEGILLNTSFIGRWEASCLILNLMLYRLFTSLPRLFTVGSGTGAPLAAACSGVIAFAVIAALLFLYKKSGSQNIIELAQKGFGNAGRCIASIVLILYMLISSAFMLREFALLVRQLAFPSAPLWFTAMFFIIAALFAAIRGFDSIIRTHVVVVPVTIFLTLAVLVSVFGYAEADNLFPLLGNGIKPLLFDGIKGLLLYSDIVLLFLINPFGGEKSKPHTKTALTAAGVGISLVTLLVLMFTATTAYPASLSVRFPIYQLLKMVYYGRFFQRIDAIYMLTAILSGMLYLSAAICLSSKLALSLICRKKTNSHTIYTVIVSIVIFASALSYELFADVRLKQFLDVFALAAVIVAAILLVRGIFCKKVQTGE